MDQFSDSYPFVFGFPVPVPDADIIESDAGDTPCCHTPYLCGGPFEECYAPPEGYNEAPSEADTPGEQYAAYEAFAAEGYADTYPFTDADMDEDGSPDCLA